MKIPLAEIYHFLTKISGFLVNTLLDIKTSQGFHVPQKQTRASLLCLGYNQEPSISPIHTHSHKYSSDEAVVYNWLQFMLYHI